MAKHSNDRLQGTLDLLVLKTLAARGAMHGYGITIEIQKISREALRVEEGSLYPVQCRIERPLFHSQRLARDLLDLDRDSVPVHRAPGRQRLQHQKIERSLQPVVGMLRHRQLGE